MTELPDPDWYLDNVVVPRAAGESAGQTRWRLAADAVRADPRIGALAVSQGFVLTRAQARERGVTDAEQRRLLRARTWWSPWYGVLCVVPAADADTRYVVRACAAALVHPGHVISHRSAAAVHGLPLVDLPGVPALTVDLTGPSRHVSASLRVRTARLEPGACTGWYGAPVTGPARTVVDVARLDRRHGLVVADAALARGLVDPHSLSMALAGTTGAPGTIAARRIVALASSASESPLESLTRLCLAEHGVPAPVLQKWIVDPRDGWRARVDLAWPGSRLIVEADGRRKYAGDELWREKRRQERLERLGWRVVRVIWADVVHHPRETAARVRAALRSS